MTDDMEDNGTAPFSPETQNSSLTELRLNACEEYDSFSDDDIDTQFGLSPYVPDNMHSPSHRIQSSPSSSRSISPSSNNIELLNLSLSTISVCSSSDDESIDQNDFNDDYYLISSDDDDRVSLEEINARIGSPPSNEQNGKRLNLETIYEGIFFETPPRKVAKSSLWHHLRNGISNPISMTNNKLPTEQQNKNVDLSHIDFMVLHEPSNGGLVNSFQQQMNLE